jgi:hypothetical protein
VHQIDAQKAREDLVNGRGITVEAEKQGRPPDDGLHGPRESRTERHLEVRGVGVIEDDELCRQKLKRGDVRHLDAHHIESSRSAALPIGQGRRGEGRAIEGSAQTFPGKEYVFGQPKHSGIEQGVATLGHLEMYSFEDSRFQELEDVKWRRYDAVNDRRSNANAEVEKKLVYSSVKPRDRGKKLGSPSEVRKGPDKGGNRLEEHPTGATSYGRSKTNVSNKVECNVPPNSPEAAYIQPRIPKRETLGFPDERSCSRAAEGPEPCHKDAVNERRSSLNVKPKRELTNFSVKP